MARKKSGPFDGKVTRFFTSFVLPVDPCRGGECSRCGACCKFLFTCPFLRSDDGKPGSFRCAIYSVRPPQCRKYPRSKGEQTYLPCGYNFEGAGSDKPGR